MQKQNMDTFVLEATTKMPWTILLTLLEQNQEANRHGFFSNGEEILCTTQEAANTIANFLEDLGFDTVCTGFYDPKEDAESGQVDSNTGFYWVAPD